ncbi:zinc finger CCCH domain-containing protein 14-like isoform X3 [Mya arenaria]|uniref:zinc finger CCCH domain-containing protein 14-like isoform X3 n=1 Tax=Mya arenaria TaxID=6604 RepID=UPI0022E32CEC|nr:zinc finger CCCH domain-containing protein 14-like isoform X3 [Mya arenaria]
MEIGAEISQKIRSAIKAKLIELGAYDDDELPDYIMVMVANKKTQKEMTNDLSLFLNTNTGKFTSWLHGLLKKLQTINAAEPSSSKPKAKEKEKHKGEKKKHRYSQGEEKHRSSQAEKVKSSKAPEAAEKVHKEGGKEERPRRVSSGDAERLNKVAAGEKRRSLEEVTKPRHPESAPADELSIDENTDEFREEAKEIAKREQTKAPSTGKPPPPKVAKSDRSVDVKRSSRPPSLDTVKARPSSSTSRGKEHKYTQDHSDSRKKPISVVGSVKRKYELEEEDEEYDPLNPAVGSVASVVHGPSRKSSVPKALQANKSLLMKAVSEAEKSVTKTKHEQEHHKTSPKLERRPVDMRHRLKTAAGQQLMSRSKRKELEMMVRTVDSEKDQVKKPHRPSGDFESIRYTVKNESASQDQTYGSKMSPKSQASGMAPSRVATSALRELKKSAVIKTEVEQADSEDSQQEVYGPIVPDTRLVQCADRGLDVKLKNSARNDESPDPEIQQLLEEAQETMLDLNDDLMYEEFKTKIREGSGSESPAEPRFIVTLDGVNPASYTAIPEAKVQPVQSVKPVQKTPVEAPKPEVPEPAAIKQLQPPKIRPFNISLKDTDDEEEMEEETSPVSAEPAQVLERCRFWPACANGNSCVYIHPSIPCKTFPYCKFGDKCIYIHPNCRFDASCTRHDCPYTHSGKRAHGSTIIHKIVQVPAYVPAPVPRAQASWAQPTPCRFFPNCRNMSCPFTHPKPCRYGIGCMHKASCQFTHPDLPGKEKLSWSSVSKQDKKTADTAKETTIPAK